MIERVNVFAQAGDDEEEDFDGDDGSDDEESGQGKKGKRTSSQTKQPSYHWNTAKFKSLWRTKFAVLMARERGRLGSDAALGDMPKRLQAHSYDEMNEGPAR